MTKGRVNFGSKIGVVAAAAGSAVGLGNIWRFPYELGQNGGAAFLLIYLFFILVLGMPVMLSELLIGRRGEKNVVGVFRALGHRKWMIIGVFGVVCAFLIMGFYVVVAGWTMEYVWQALTQRLADRSVSELTGAFTAFSTDTTRPIVWLIAFMVLCCVIIVAGVKEGIERSSKILMPLLLVLLLVLCVRSLSLSGGVEGLQFLFRPDFSKIDSSVILSAMGQAFFSLSLGMGCMITYGSYISKKSNLGHTVAEVTLLDTLIAIFASIAIFPAVFALGINPAQGPELVFITLPSVFNQIPGGYVWALLFFVLLTIAALTSAISLLEVITSSLSEELGISRKKATIFSAVTICVLGSLSSLSLGVWSDITIFGKGLFALLDSFTSTILMPLGCLAVTIFVGWVLDAKVVEAELSNGGKVRLKYLKPFWFLIKYIVPVAILIVFIHRLL